MIAALISVVAPVFLLIASGYLLVWFRVLAAGHIDGLMAYTQRFAVPVLLFSATANLDLGAVFDARLLFSYYASATVSFALGILAARTLFRRRPGEAVAIGFGALFSNSVILGLAILQRAYGPEVLAPAYAIVSIHAAYCYILGTLVMEFSRADGRSLGATLATTVEASLRNALMIGVLLGFAVNLAGLSLPGILRDATELIIRTAIPTALVAVGGVLVRYRLQDSLGEALVTMVLSLVVRPLMVLGLAAYVFDLPHPFVQAAVLIAAMAPGINTYIFASLYGRAEAVAANTIILTTLASVASVSVWLTILGPSP